MMCDGWKRISLNMQVMGASVCRSVTKTRRCSDSGKLHFFSFPFLRTQRTTGPMQCLPVLASVVSSHQPNNDVISECQDKLSVH